MSVNYSSHRIKCAMIFHEPPVINLKKHLNLSMKKIKCKWIAITIRTIFLIRWNAVKITGQVGKKKLDHYNKIRTIFPC